MVDVVQSFLGLRQTADIDIVLDGAETRKMAEIKTEDGKKEKHYLYFDGESVSGKVGVDIPVVKTNNDNVYSLP